MKTRNNPSMGHAHGTGLLVLVLVIGSLVGSRSDAVEQPQVRDIKVTLASDGEHCAVRGVTILCSDLAAHLRDRLKLPKETLILLRADGAAPYQSVRRTLGIIEKSGFNYPVAATPKPKSAQHQEN